MTVTNINIKKVSEIKAKHKLNIKPDVPNKVTAAAISEGRSIAHDKNIKGYKDIDDLKKVL